MLFVNIRADESQNSVTLNTTFTYNQTHTNKIEVQQKLLHLRTFLKIQQWNQTMIPTNVMQEKHL